MNWRENIFDNFVRLKRGFDLPEAKLNPGPYPVVTSSSITSYHKEFKARGPGVVTGRSGSLGIVQYVPEDYWPHNTALYVRDFRGNFPRYAYYFLQKMRLENFNSGAGVPTLNQNHLHKLKIRIPSVPIQKKIAGILTAYDDLIENNKRRISLLENLAEEIYREWFVRLRFPGYQKVEITKRVPNGWTLMKVEHAFKFTGGGTPAKEVDRYWNDGDVNWFTPSDITSADGTFIERSGEQCTEEGVNNSSARMFPAYSLMLTSRATIGAIGINTTPACSNQGFITCIPNERYPLPYLYYWLKLAKPHFELLAGGATFAELTKGTFKRIEILTPPQPITTEFARIVSPLFKNIETLLAVSRKLIETRDRLLPRLISGKLSVEHLDIRFPPGMAEEVQSDCMMDTRISAEGYG
jgi:type I restriction enzyme, S subunit